MISVVVPCYNEPAERLDATIASILETIGDDGEIVIVNDGGAPVEVQGDTVRVINLPENRGPAGALNVGYGAAQFDLICRCDVGDRWYPDAKRRQIDAAIANGWRACFGLSVDELTGQPWPFDAARWHRRIYRDNQFQASTWLVRREVWAAVAFDETLRYADDWGWAMRVQWQFGWIPFTEVVGTATQWPGGHSDTGKNDARRERHMADRTRVYRLGLSLRHKLRPRGAV